MGYLLAHLLILCLSVMVLEAIHIYRKQPRIQAIMRNISIRENQLQDQGLKAGAAKLINRTGYLFYLACKASKRHQSPKIVSLKRFVAKANEKLRCI